MGVASTLETEHGGLTLGVSTWGLDLKIAAVCTSAPARSTPVKATPYFKCSHLDPRSVLPASISRRAFKR